MTRESKNNNDGAVFTYHERRKMDHGTTHLRLPAAALKPWHHCALRLFPAESPVITPQGVLFDREAIVLNLLQQKRRITAQRLKEEAQKNREDRNRAHYEQTRRREEESRFEERQNAANVTEEDRTKEDQPKNQTVASNFWLPGSDDSTIHTTSRAAKKRKRDGPPNRTVCPIGGQSLKSRDLITLKPTLLGKDKKSSENANELGSKSSQSNLEALYVCPVCQAVLVNAAKPVALRTGTVVCTKCADDFVRKESRDPITGAELNLKSDVIDIQNAGTAFAASSSDNPASKEAKIYRPSVR